MSFCTQCGTKLAPGDRFCPNCGAAVTRNVSCDFESQSFDAVPEPLACTMPQTPVVPTKAKVFGFVGMGLAIAGLFFSVIGVLMTLVTVEVEGLALAMAIAYGLLSAPFTITGLVLSAKSKGLGFRGAAATAGVSLGIVSVILIVISLLAGIAGAA